MSVYSRSLPLLSFHFLYITEASTLAGEKVLGSLRREMTLRRMVLGEAAGVGVGAVHPGASCPDPVRHPPPALCCVPGSWDGTWVDSQGQDHLPSAGAGLSPPWGILPGVGPLCHSFSLQPGEEESARTAQGEHSTGGWKGCAPWGSRKEGGPQGHADTATGVPETVPEGGWGRDGRKWGRGRQGWGLWREVAPTDAATQQGAASSRVHIHRAGLPDADRLT